MPGSVGYCWKSANFLAWFPMQSASASISQPTVRHLSALCSTSSRRRGGLDAANAARETKSTVPSLCATAAAPTSNLFMALSCESKKLRYLHMCDTCGCSDDSSLQAIDPAERITTDLSGTPSAHGHTHEHSAGPERPHAHTDGAPDDRQQHGHEHAHDGHGRGQAHDHHSREQSGALNDHPASRIVRFEQNVLAKNNLIAERNRGWFEGRGILALNLMSSPGAGKTTLLERMLADLSKEVWLSVIEGDQETARDAERIRRAGAQAIQINTGSGCHLDAQMISAALRKLAPPAHSLVMIENVGNLVCPALFDLGGAG